MILVFTACGLCNKATFIGDEISDTDFYDIAFEQMNSTHSHNIDMDAGESIKVKIISKSGKISVQIYNEDDQPVYRGDDVTDAEFEIQINEKGTYRLCVSGKEAKGHVIFSRCFVSIGTVCMTNRLILFVAVGIICWSYMSLLLVVTEEKWLRDLYGKQYEDYCNRVNRGIPLFRNNVL